MKTILTGSILFLAIGVISACAQTQRDILIAKSLDCAAQHQNSGLSWNDVCVVSQDSINNTSSSLNDLSDYQSQSLPAPIFIQRVHTFSFSPEYFYFHYSEPEKSKRVTGNWRGLDGGYTFRPAEDSLFNTPVINYYAIQGEYATGSNTWGSNLQRQYSNNSFVYTKLKNIPSYMYEGRILIGKDIIPISNLRFTPYTGVGARYQTDHEGNNLITLDDGSPYTPINQSNLYYYVPTGFNIDLAASDSYEISWNTEYDYIVKGYENLEYAQADVFNFAPGAGGGPSSNLHFSITHGWGARTSIRLLKHFSSMDLFLEPYVRYWHVSPSKAASGYEETDYFTTQESKNSTFELGSSLGVQF